MEKSEAPASLVRRVESYAAKAEALGWEAKCDYDQSIRGYLHGTLRARRHLTEHVIESVAISWSFSSLAMKGVQLRFSQAHRLLVQLYNESGDWRERSVGSTYKFRTLPEAVEFLARKADGTTSADRQAILAARITSTNKENTTMAASATKKAPAKKVPAKKVPAKAAAAKKAAPKTDDVIEDTTTKAAERAAEVEARREAREAEKEQQRLDVVRLRDKEEKSWSETASEMGIDVNTATIRYLEATEYATPTNPTPAALRKARESENLSWGQIMAKFRFATKSSAQKAYVEAGGDLAYQVGRGGRFIEHAAKAAPAKKATGSTKKAPAAGKAVFAADVSADDVKAKIIGKTITVKVGNGTATHKVPADVKVGKDKSGTRVVQFDDNGKRTIALANIVKVGR